MEIGTVRRVDIVEEMRGAYLDYAMSVITARALPDVRDGLKPVQRRILYAMNDMGLHHDRPYRKSARIVGEVLGKYHPHGDSAVYDAMVRMAQDFAMRYPVVDGQGNFGSIDGDNAAAMRYTEARLASVAHELLQDIDKETVDFLDNFDGSLKEPSVLPARMPNLLLNGTAGIAVGMATNIPPHNLTELADAVCFLVDNYRKLDDVTVDDLMKFVLGPDFPTGGSILGREGIRSAYATGKGKIVVRAKAHIEDLKGGRSAIIVTELPYQVGKAGLIEKIADLVRDRRLETISDLRDESDRAGMRIVVELKRGVEAGTALNQLLKYTALQTTFGVNMLALVDGEPRMLSLKRALHLFIEHRREVIVRRTRYELERAQHRAHVLEGLRIALDNLDAVIDTIRRSQTADTALNNLRRQFKLTEIQARAILDMQLRRLAALERKKIEDEYTELVGRIEEFKAILASPEKVLGLVKEEMKELKKKYGDARRTRIGDDEAEEFSAEDLIAEEDVFIILTERGYIKRQQASSYRAVRGGGRGVAGIATTDKDRVLFVFSASTLDTILCFSNRGKVYQIPAHGIPDVERHAKGVPMSNLVSLESGERVTAAIAVPSFDEGESFTMVTLQGMGKRVEMKEFETVRPSGLVAIGLKEGDELGWVRLTDGKQELIIVCDQGKAIRFPEESMRTMGRSATGVITMKLDDGTQVTSMDVVDPDGELLIITENGYAKRTPMNEYPPQGRGGAGVLTMDTKYLDQVGRITAARVVHPDDELVFASAAGMVLRVRASAVPQLKRAYWSSRILPTSKLMELSEGDKLVSVTCFTSGGSKLSPDSSPEPIRTRGRKGEGASPKTREEKASAGAKKAAKRTVKSRATAKGSVETANTTTRKARKKTKNRTEKSEAAEKGAVEAPSNSTKTARKRGSRKTKTRDSDDTKVAQATAEAVQLALEEKQPAKPRRSRATGGSRSQPGTLPRKKGGSPSKRKSGSQTGKKTPLTGRRSAKKG